MKNSRKQLLKATFSLTTVLLASACSMTPNEHLNNDSTSVSSNHAICTQNVEKANTTPIIAAGVAGAVTLNPVAALLVGGLAYVSQPLLKKECMDSISSNPKRQASNLIHHIRNTKD